jgi:hypothetical protein
VCNTGKVFAGGTSYMNVRFDVFIQLKIHVVCSGLCYLVVW